MKFFLAVVTLFISSIAFANPTLTPNSGNVSANQTFMYATNGTAVQNFSFHIGTNVGARDIVDSGGLGAADGTYTATLPTGQIHVRL